MPLVVLRNVEIFEVSSVWRGFDNLAKIGRSSDNQKVNNLTADVNAHQEEGKRLFTSESAKIRMRILALQTQI
jgi:hypothetical protein